VSPAKKAVTWSRDRGWNALPCRLRPNFLRSQTQALLGADFIETVMMAGAGMHILAVIEHASRQVPILGATAHPTAAWVIQTARNLAVDLENAGCRIKYLIRDRDGKDPVLFDTILADAGITVVRSGVHMPAGRYRDLRRQRRAHRCSCSGVGSAPVWDFSRVRALAQSTVANAGSRSAEDCAAAAGWRPVRSRRRVALRNVDARPIPRRPGPVG
jgi:hypothetical protein